MYDGDGPDTNMLAMCTIEIEVMLYIRSCKCGSGYESSFKCGCLVNEKTVRVIGRPVLIEASLMCILNCIYCVDWKPTLIER